MKARPSKILYVASTSSHLKRFHIPYIQKLKEHFEVFTMANGEDVDFSIPFHKSLVSLSNLKSILKIRRILKQERFDLLILHTTLAAFLVRAALFGIRKRPRVINVMHGYLFSYPPKSIKDRILFFCERITKGKTDDLAVMNAEDLMIAKKHSLCLENLYFMHGMGLENQKYDRTPDPLLRSKYASKSDVICTFVGELSKRKNQEFLIHAAKELRERALPIKLLLVGGGGEYDRLKQEIESHVLTDSVFLIGETDRVNAYLSITDIYVSASVSEGLPFNVLEAMYYGLPIVASDTKGQNDLLRDFPDTLYPLGDTVSFCDAIERLCKEKNYGVLSRDYPNLRDYLLEKVIEDNMKIFTVGLNTNEQLS